MANVFYPNWPPSNINAEFPPVANIAANIGDLAVRSVGNSNSPLPASLTANLLSTANIQANVARNFMGVFNSARLTNDANVTTAVRLLVDGIYEFPLGANDALSVGDYVGANVVANVVNAQKVDRVASEELAIGRVVKQRATSEAFKVKVRLMSRFLLGMPDRYRDLGGVGQGTARDNTTAAANIVLTIANKPSQVINADGIDRVITVPGNPGNMTGVAGKMFWFRANNAANTLTIKDDAASPNTIVVCAANKAAVVWADDTGWVGLAGN